MAKEHKSEEAESARIECHVSDCAHHRRSDDSCRSREHPILEVVHHGRLRREFVCRTFEDKDTA